MAQILRSPSIQTAAQDPRVERAMEAYIQRRQLLNRIERQNVVIAVLLIALGLMAGIMAVMP